MKLPFIAAALFTTACAPIPFVQPTPPQPQQQYYQQGAPAPAPNQQQYAPARNQVSQAGALEQGLTPHTAIQIQPGVAIEGLFQNGNPDNRYYTLPMSAGNLMRATPTLTVTSGSCALYFVVNNSSGQKIDRGYFNSRSPGEFWEFKAPYDDNYQIVLSDGCRSKTLTFRVDIHVN